MTIDGPAWPPGLGWDGHLLLVHATESERREQVAAWVSAGLEARRRIVYVVDPGPGEDEPLLDQLAGAGFDGRAAVDSGGLVILPADRFYTDDAPEGLVAGALADGYVGVSFSGEATMALRTLSAAQYRRFEHFMTRFCNQLPASTLCQFDLTLDSDWTLAQTVDAHLPGGIRHRLLRSVGGTGHLQVAGEVDASDAELFGALLAAAGDASPPCGRLEVDLRNLTWISAAGLHALTYGTQPFRDGGGCVRLEVVPGSAVDRTLRLLDLNLPPGVAVGHA